MNPSELKYSKEHEWIKIEDNIGTIGVTDFAQKQLREIVYAELPSAGDQTTQNEPYGTVESVKAVSDLIAPLSGTIEKVNDEVQDSPELLNEDPYTKGWLLLIAPSNMDELKGLMEHTKSVEWHKNLEKK